MKTFQNNYTTPEQSRRLLELGLPADSADAFCVNVPDGITDVDILLVHRDETYTQRIASICEQFESRVTADAYMPCWSLGRLIEIIKLCYVGESRDIDAILTGLRMFDNQVLVMVQAFKDYAYFIALSKLEELV